MWLLDLLPPGMLFRGLLYFIVHVNRRCLQFADKSCTFLVLRCPFPPGLRLYPHFSYPPNFQQKLIWPWGKSSQHWLRSGTSSKYPIVLSVHCILLLPLSFILSLPLILPAPHSHSPLYYSYEFHTDPHLLLIADGCAAARGGFHNMVIVNCRHLYGWVHDPHLQIQ